MSGQQGYPAPPPRAPTLAPPRREGGGHVEQPRGRIDGGVQHVGAEAHAGHGAKGERGRQLHAEAEGPARVRARAHKHDAVPLYPRGAGEPPAACPSEAGEARESEGARSGESARGSTKTPGTRARPSSLLRGP